MLGCETTYFGTQMDIYIGNLPYQINQEELIELFSKFGEVSGATLIADRETGKSKGFGFVQMPNSEEAEQAITDLNESQNDGRTIVVNQAKPKN